MDTTTPIPASVYIITLNAAARLYQLLSQLKAFEEVVIVDCGSTDQTAEIARGFANVRFSHHDWSSFSEQKAYALSLCQCEWVLNLDADEEPSQELLDEIRATIRANDCDALESSRMVFRWGRRSPYFTKDSWQVRFFRKSTGHYERRRVHERISIQGTIRRTSACIIHHQDLTLDELVQKLNLYSQLKAMDKYEKGSRANFLILFFIFPITFIQYYLLKGYFLGGIDGLTGSVNIAFYNFMKYAKLWEKTRGHSQFNNLIEPRHEVGQLSVSGKPKQGKA